MRSGERVERCRVSWKRSKRRRSWTTRGSLCGSPCRPSAFVRNLRRSFWSVSQWFISTSDMDARQHQFHAGHDRVHRALVERFPRGAPTCSQRSKFAEGKKCSGGDGGAPAQHHNQRRDAKASHLWMPALHEYDHDQRDVKRFLAELRHAENASFIREKMATYWQGCQRSKPKSD